MVIIIAHIRLPPENVKMAAPMIARIVQASRAEDGCEHFSFAEDLLDPGLLRLSECWRDQAAADRHGQAPHMLEWRNARESLGIMERGIAIHEGVLVRKA